MNQDSSKRAPNSPKWSPKWLNTARSRSKWLPTYSKKSTKNAHRSTTGPTDRGGSPGQPQENQLRPKPKDIN
eukprot:5983769-Pyramimonas_sp.AAC.1